MIIIIFTLQAGELYAPGGLHESLGWERKGWCDGTTAPTSSPIQLTDVCEDDPWSLSNIAFYEEGDRVRKSDRIYECKAWPYSLKCTDSYYEPETSSHWQEAWMYVDDCETVEEVTATIQGTLTINIGSRRSLVSIDGLNEDEIDDLTISAQDAIEDGACSGFSDDYICVIDVVSINDQSLTRHLRQSSQRELLPAAFIIKFLAQVTQTVQDMTNVQAVAISMRSMLSTGLNNAISNNSFRSSLVGNASTTAVRNIDFGTTTSVTQPPQVELRRVTRNRDREGGERCSGDNQCASNKCRRGGGACRWPRKCCQVRLLLFTFYYLILLILRCDHFY